MKNTANYINENKEKFVNDLFDLLRIPSVSADPAFKGDVQKCAKTVKDHLIAAGADNVEIIPTKGHPIVYGEKIISSELPTVLVYGHYDVQPADPIELWDTPPFEPTVKDGKVYARGASDDKGQMFMHVKAFESMMKADELPCNVKFMIEGEEEVGSKHLGEFLIENTNKLKADVILVSDTGMIGL